MPEHPSTRSYDLPPGLIERVDLALAAIRDLPREPDERHPALVAFGHSPAIEEMIKTFLDGEVRSQDRGFHRLGTTDQVLAVASVLHTAIAHNLVSVPATAYDVAKIVETIVFNMVREAAEVTVLAGIATVDEVRDTEYRARAAAYRAASGYRSPVALEGEEEGIGDFFVAIVQSQLHLFALTYARDVPPDPDIYLYLEGLDAFFTRTLDAARRRVTNSNRYPKGTCQLPSDDQLRDPDEDDGDDLSRAKLTSPPDRPGNGGLGLALGTILSFEQRRDQQRIESLQDLVKTAQKVLHGKQRIALMTKLFSPRQREMRRSLIIVCATVLGELPQEVGSDDELALLIGSPTAGAAQRNYNLGRRKLLQHAKDRDQRREWEVILDALLPRRSRHTDPVTGE